MLLSNPSILSEGTSTPSDNPRHPNERYRHKNVLTMALKASPSRVTSSICSRARSSASDSWFSFKYCLTASPYFPCLPRITARVDPRSCSTTNSIISSSSSLKRSAAFLRDCKAAPQERGNLDLLQLFRLQIGHARHFLDALHCVRIYLGLVFLDNRDRIVKQIVIETIRCCLGKLVC